LEYLFVLLTADEKSILIPGPEGQIEAVLAEPKMIPAESVTHWAIVCHPDPLQQGSMHHKVVTTVSRLFFDKGCATLRFNYRGVGQSAGSYGNIMGEVDDLWAVLHWAQAHAPGRKLWLAGFSFGSYVAAHVASMHETEGLIMIAPSLNRFPFQAIQNNLPHNAFLVQGMQDDVIAPGPESVLDWAASCHPAPSILTMDEAGHFFHGQLGGLKRLIDDAVDPWFSAKDAL
jgi:uncharacterized protein